MSVLKVLKFQIVLMTNSLQSRKFFENENLENETNSQYITVL